MVPFLTSAWTLVLISGTTFSWHRKGRRPDGGDAALGAGRARAPPHQRRHGRALVPQLHRLALPIPALEHGRPGESSAAVPGPSPLF